MPVRSSYAHGVPNWVDLSTTDTDAARAFYADLLGWQYRAEPTDQGGTYIMATKDDQVVAGMMQMLPAMQAQGAPSMWNTYVAVDDVDTVVGGVEAAGGQVMMPPTEVMEHGRMAMLVDPTGGVLGLWQARGHHGASLVNEPGAVCWNELQTPDPGKAATFFEAVLGWTSQSQDMGDGSVYTVFNVGDEGIAGAMVPPQPEIPTHWSVVFAVDDARAVATRAIELGGAVHAEPFDMFVGTLTVLGDPTGAAFQALQMTPPD